MASKKKILFVVNYISGGGVEKMLVNAVSSICNDFEVEVLSIYNFRSFFFDKVKEYVPVKTLDRLRWIVRLPLIGALYTRIFDKEIVHNKLFRLFLRRNRYDIIVAYAEGYALKMVADSILTNSKKILWIHTDFLTDSTWISNNSKTLQHNLSAFDDVVFVCESLRQKFEGMFHIKHSRSIKNAIDIEGIKLLGNIPLNTNRKGRIEFISVGRLSGEKGHDRLLTCLSSIPQEERERCHLTIVGGGAMEDGLKKFVRDNKLDNEVSFTGAVSNPYKYIKQADILILASKYEGFGLVLLEAMALGVPVAATATTGSCDVLEDGKNGLLIPNDDVSLLETFRRLLKDPGCLEKYHPFASKRVKEFSTETFKQNMIKYFGNV